MGREVQCLCRWGAEAGIVKALLESDEIIIRGAIKHRVRLAEIRHMQADAAGLQFTAGRDRVTLSMPREEGARWFKKINAPPPSLRDKLGLGDAVKALVVGEISDVTLKEALDGCTATSDAKIVIAIARNDRQLAAAARTYHRLAAGTAIWIVYEKGKDAKFGETLVRAGMRAMGYVDTKVASVSTGLTASRFSTKKKQPP
jgi:hypothetical protein